MEHVIESPTWRSGIDVYQPSGPPKHICDVSEKYEDICGKECEGPYLAAVERVDLACEGCGCAFNPSEPWVRREDDGRMWCPRCTAKAGDLRRLTREDWNDIANGRN